MIASAASTWAIRASGGVEAGDDAVSLDGLDMGAQGGQRIDERCPAFGGAGEQEAATLEPMIEAFCQQLDHGLGPEGVRDKHLTLDLG